VLEPPNKQTLIICPETCPTPDKSWMVICPECTLQMMMQSIGWQTLEGKPAYNRRPTNHKDMQTDNAMRDTTHWCMWDCG